MMKRLKLLTAVGLLTAVFAAPLAYAAGLFNGYPVGNGASYCSGYSSYPTTATTPGTLPTPNQCNSTVPAGPALTGSEYIPADTAVPGAVTQTAPSTILMADTTIAGMNFANPKNFLGNGALNITQTNGTNTVTFATTSSPTYAALVADRWVGDVNVASGAGRSAIVTATPSPPTGFTQTAKVYRTSGGLTQPVCAWQAVPTPDSVQLAGQVVTFSAYLDALAGLSADNANQATLVIIAGSGTDQGFNGSWTASPAITPAWTNITTVVTTNLNISTTWTRYATTATIPATVGTSSAATTEIGVGICFTPTASGAGSTDGFAFTGAQLERGPVMSAYEVRSKALDLVLAQEFNYAVVDTAGPSPVITMCTETTANTDAACYLQYPQTMYKTPTVSLVNCGTACFAMPTTTAQTAVTSTCVLTVNATFTYVQGPQGTYLQCAQSGTTAAVGISLPLMMSTSATNGGIIEAWTGL
jgi:hypothetical protein